VVIDLEVVNFIDSQRSAKLGDILALREQADVALRPDRAKPGVRAVLEREEFNDRLGHDHIHGNVHRAVQAQTGRPQLGGDQTAARSALGARCSLSAPTRRS